MGYMLKIISMHKRYRKGTKKSNIVTLCLFYGLNPNKFPLA